MDTIYADNNATTYMHQDVIEAMLSTMKGNPGNPSSHHRQGRQAREAVEHSRRQVACLIGASDPREVVFTSGGTEADNLAIQGVFLAVVKEGKNHIVTSRIEHPAVLKTCRYLEQHGAQVTYVNVNQEGIVDPGEFQRSLRETTALVSLMHANNETGAVQPIQEVAEFAANRGIPVHVDAVQSAGKLALHVASSPISLLSLSAHKFGGPKGVGALFVRDGVRVAPVLYGGRQERAIRAGTENVAGIVGFGMAAELAAKTRMEQHDTQRRLLERLWNGLAERIPNILVHTPSDQAKRLPNTLSVSFSGIDGELMVLELDRRGICVSSGSACSSGSATPSHVLTAMGVPLRQALGAVRFSLGRLNTEEQVARIIDAVCEIVGNSPGAVDRQQAGRHCRAEFRKNGSVPIAV